MVCIGSSSELVWVSKTTSLVDTDGVAEIHRNRPDEFPFARVRLRRAASRAVAAELARDAVHREADRPGETALVVDLDHVAARRRVLDVL
jgi:hypothetical protein